MISLSSAWLWTLWWAAKLVALAIVIPVMSYVAYIVFLALRTTWTLSKMRDIPGLTGPFETAKFMAKFKGEFHLAMRELVNQYGTFYKSNFMVMPSVGIADPELLRTVWASPGLPKSSFYQQTSRFIGSNILTEDGETWKNLRKLTQGGFMPTQLQSYIGHFQRHGDTLCRVLGDLCDREPGGPTRVRIDQLVQRATLDIIAATGMRYDLGCLDGRNTDVVDALNEVLGCLSSPLVTFPLGGYFMRLLHRRALRTVDRVIYDAIERGAKDLPADGAPPRDLLDVLLLARDDAGRGMSRQSVRNQVLLFFIAGQDTTAITLTFALHQLTQNPECMRRCVAEVDAVVGRDMPGAEHLARLPYLTMVLKETLRMYAPVAGASRRTTAPVPIGAHTLPAGVMVIAAIDAMQHRPDLYPEPSVFRPERFSDEASAARHPFAWSPFTQGPRICLGMNFFWMEGRILLARLLQQFTFEAEPGFSLVATSLTGTMKPRDGLPLRVRRRCA